MEEAQKSKNVLDERQDRLQKMDETKKEVWICTDCGREFEKIPFPNPCGCGNIDQDAYRLREKNEGVGAQGKAPAQEIESEHPVKITQPVEAGPPKADEKDLQTPSGDVGEAGRD